MNLIVGICIGISVIPLLYISTCYYKAMKRVRVLNKYEKLWKGVPRHTKYLTSRRDLRKYSNCPFIIDGEVYYRNHYNGRHYHCNEESVVVRRASDSERFIIRPCERYMSKVASVRDLKGRYIRCNNFAAILEVY